MRVFYVDPSSYKEHSSFNKNNLAILQELCELSVFFKKGYFEEGHYNIKSNYECELKCFPSDIYSKSKTKLGRFVKNKLGQLKIFKRILNIAKKEKFDLIIFSCVDVFILSLLTKFTSLNIAFYEHGLYLTTTNKGKWIKKWWRFLNKKVKVIILEEYFSDYIKNNLHCKNKLFLIRHPIGEFSINNCSLIERKKILFAPSLGNDEVFIKTLIEKESIIPNGFYIVARSTVEYKSDKLHIYKNYLPKDEYNDCLNSCSCFLILYDKRYMYRTSAVLFEGVSRKKKIFMLGGNTLEYYAKKYPSFFEIFNSFDEFILCLQNTQSINIGEINSDDYENFMNDYSNENLKQSFIRLLNDEDYESVNS